MFAHFGERDLSVPLSDWVLLKEINGKQHGFNEME